MKILVVGQGGREHALAWSLAKPDYVEKVYVAFGNSGMEQEEKIERVRYMDYDVNSLLKQAKKLKVDLTVVGPEVPLSLGIVDLFEEHGLKIFGPTQAAARLESSKSYCKDFLKKYEIPTAEYGSFSDPEEAIEYMMYRGAPIVIKADGLAAGKGVIIAESCKEAKATIEDMLSGNSFGEAGSRVVIEEFLEGEEASFIVMCDGENIVPLATSQDHKRAHDGDRGPNTGGMGAYSPAPVVTPEIHEKIMERIIKPTVEGMKKEGTPYKGFLYAGLMIDKHGDPKVIEYNCRCGDPETQPIMMRLKSDLAELCMKACDGQLDQCEAVFDERAALGVVLASGGYPYGFGKGKVISGLKYINPDNTKVFHAATVMQKEGLLTNGGRVLCVTSLGENVTEAKKAAYREADKISYENCFYRKDIGYRAVEREKKLAE